MSGDDGARDGEEVLLPPAGDPGSTASLEVVLPLPPASRPASASGLEATAAAGVERAAPGASGPEDPRATREMTTVLPLPAGAPGPGASSGAREGAATVEARRVGAGSGARAPGGARPDREAEAPAPTAAFPAVEPWDPTRGSPLDGGGGEGPGRAVDSQAITEVNGQARGASAGSIDAAEVSSAGERAPVAVSVRRPGPEEATTGVGLAIPGLRLGSELGRGAQGIVYRAAPAGGGPEVAVKVLRPEADDEEIGRFERALEAMDALRGVPGIVQARARGRTVLGQPWFSMDLVQGPSLRTALQDGLLPPRALVAVVADAARAVHDAHDRGIVHRDLKPENVLVDVLPDGTCAARVADFGLARDLHAGATSSVDGAGTLAYMAPEQVTGGEVTRRTDIHALGALLYEVITGAPPFRRPTPAAIAQAIASEAPRAPATLWSGLPAPLAAITLRALAKDPAGRQQTAAQLATQLERALAGETVDDVPASPRAPAGGPGLLRRAVDGLRARSRFLRGVALGVVLGTGLGWLAAQTGWAPSRLDPRAAPRPAPTRRR